VVGDKVASERSGHSWHQAKRSAGLRELHIGAALVLPQSQPRDSKIEPVLYSTGLPFRS